MLLFFVRFITLKESVSDTVVHLKLHYSMLKALTWISIYHLETEA